ncbi:MAG TPA: XdhC family protein [Acidimicrobiia bacterium]|nr:XdhC family protein [Acidimicrobiia bacterium]
MDPLAEAARVVGEGRPVALATVTWRQGLTSGKPGAKALIYPDGRVEGWLGGACARPAVVRHALEALADGHPRLLVLGVGDARPGVIQVEMACSSEGAMEVYVEPMLPAPRAVVVGNSPAALLLAELAGRVGWRITLTDTEPDAGAMSKNDAVVVATQGHFDETALQAALGSPAGYVGLVASSKRASEVLAWLRGRGVSEEELARVRAPAGLDLGATSHEEIAVSILAELVAWRAAGGARPVMNIEQPEVAIDPVCQMEVEVATARWVTEHEGKKYYFCAPGCQKSFEANPERYLG